ncbi:MAG: DCC1-like thiol-disulfide oxidoreductase family protein [Pseudomonadota bacterium]
MATTSDPLTPATPTVVYDDDCPFCRNYVQMLRIREAVGPVTLIDARAGGPVVAALQDAGYDLDEGMVLLMQGQVHHGAEAMTRMALLSSGSTAFNRLNAVIFRHAGMSRVLYPVLRFGRGVTLRLLGRTPIQGPAPATGHSSQSAASASPR